MIDAETDPIYRLSRAFRRQVPVKFNCLFEYQARVEYGSESSIVSEPRTLGGLVLPLWGILTPQLPSRRSKAARGRDFKYSSRVHRPSKYPAAAGNQLLLFRLFCNLPLASQKDISVIFPSVFIRLCAVPSTHPHSPATLIQLELAPYRNRWSKERKIWISSNGVSRKMRKYIETQFSPSNLFLFFNLLAFESDGFLF